MTDGPINLNRARKTRARRAVKAQADANAVAFGRTKSERAADTLRESAATKRLDANKRASDADAATPGADDTGAKDAKPS